MKAILFVLVSLLFLKTFSQNLVVNSSFEDPNICERHEHCNPAGWFDVSKQPHGYWIDESAGASGYRWINVITGSRISNARQYWQTILLENLEKGKKYHVSLSIKGWETNPYLVDIGFYFGDTLLSILPGTIIQLQDYLGFTDAKYKRQRDGWFRLEKDYVARANSKVLVVGNFSKNDYQEVAKKRISKTVYIATKVDDIEIIPDLKHDCKTCSKMKDSLYNITKRHFEINLADTGFSERFVEKRASKIDTIVVNDIYFDFGSFKIGNSNKIENYRKVFTGIPLTKILIVGFADEVGSLARNKDLSEKRAFEVAKLLSLRFGISSSIIETQGKGVSTRFKEKVRNRRVDIYIYR